MILDTRAAAAVVDGLAQREQDKYARIWELEQYHKHSPGASQRPFIIAKLRGADVRTVVELGAGTGRLAWALHLAAGLDVQMVDIVDNALDPEMVLRLSGRFRFLMASAWAPEVRALRADATVSTDVLEHIPPERIEDVLDGLAEIAPHGVHGIALCPDTSGRAIGETLHLCVEPAEWWLEQFDRRFGKVQCQKFAPHYVRIWY